MPTPSPPSKLSLSPKRLLFGALCTKMLFAVSLDASSDELEPAAWSWSEMALAEGGACEGSREMTSRSSCSPAAAGPVLLLTVEERGWPEAPSRGQQPRAHSGKRQVGWRGGGPCARAHKGLFKFLSGAKE